MPKKLKLVYDLYALSMIEEVSGRSVMMLVTELDNVGKTDTAKVFQTLKILLWAGMLYENEKLSMREACKGMAGMSLVGLSRAIGEAVKESELFEGVDSSANTSTNPQTE
ncbi:MAG: hypothetical protein HQM10_03915 [Candidatus Riflebacteria bacterium]|nr:hypothetical protein [Candidatus Riflebacteria bacterium]